MDRRALRRVLSRSTWFRGIPSTLADGIVALGRVRRFRDRTIYAAGDRANGLFALLSGDVRIIQIGGEGHYVLLKAAAPGAWFGESSVLDGKPRFTDAVAIGDVEVLQLDLVAFEQLTAHDTRHYAAFVQLLSEHYRQAIDYIVASAAFPPLVRLAQRLIGLGQSHGRSGGGGGTLIPRLSQEALAATLGVSRPTLNRLLKKLERQGLISLGYASVTLIDQPALHRLAGEGVKD